MGDDYLRGGDPRGAEGSPIGQMTATARPSSGSGKVSGVSVLEGRYVRARAADGREVELDLAVILDAVKWTGGRLEVYAQLQIDGSICWMLKTADPERPLVAMGTLRDGGGE